MNQNLPPDLSEAVRLLESFEKSNNHFERTRDFEEAIEIFNDYLMDSPDSPYRKLIENLKRTYTRKLLEQLPSLSSDMDINDWFNYLKILLFSVSKETEDLSKKYPHLGQNVQEFLAIRREEVIAALQKDIESYQVH